jgi:hypothetical protein
MSYSNLNTKTAGQDIKDKIKQKKSLLVNRPSEWVDDSPKKLIDLGVGSPNVYAFVEDANGHRDLWTLCKTEVFKSEELRSWIEVTDLSDIPVWEYVKLREYAIVCDVISKDAESWKI